MSQEFLFPLFPFFLFYFIFFFLVNKYHHHRCIWSNAKITWAKQWKEKRKDHLPIERTKFCCCEEMIQLWGVCIWETINLMKIPFTQKGQNQFDWYKKRDERNYTSNKMLSFYNKRYSHRRLTQLFFFSSFLHLSLSFARVLLHNHIFAFLYNNKNDGARKRTVEWDGSAA